MSTKGKLQTKYGEVEYTACGGADYVHVGTFDNTPITVFGVNYTASYRMKRVNGAWEPEGSGALYLSRVGSFTNGTEAARKAIRQAFAGAWTAFIEEHPEVLDEAASEKLEREIKRLASERQEAWELYEQLGKELEIKHKELFALGELISRKRFTKEVA